VLRLPPIDLRAPRTLTEAAGILAGEGPDARAVAGGTDLWPNMKRRHQHARTVVSLMGIEALRGLDADDGLRVGATARLSEIVRDAAVRERYPAFARAVASISSPPLRNMGTLGGNLCVDTRCTYYNQTEEWRRAIDYCLKEAGEICWVATKSPRCWAHSASDAAPILCALDARVRLASNGGERIVPLADLYRDDGIDYLSKRPDEILVDVRLPSESDARHCRSSFWKLRRRGSIDFSVFSAACAVWTDARGNVERAALYLGAVASSPLRVADAEAVLTGAPLGAQRIDAAAHLAHKAATPMDNTDFAPAWRGKMVEAYTRAALRQLAGLPAGIAAPHHGLTVV
jgi:4-hydroxybenzoyl-CoA reductase subunit beta